MKLVAFVLIALLLNSCDADKKYRIRTPDKVYHTDYLTHAGPSCITFDVSCGCGDSDKKTRVTVCGSYSIETIE